MRVDGASAPPPGEADRVLAASTDPADPVPGRSAAPDGPAAPAADG